MGAVNYGRYNGSDCGGASSGGMEFVAEHCGAFSCDALEQAGEMLWILEAQVVGYDAYVVVGRGEPAFGLGDEVERYQFLGRVAGFAFDEVSEISGREVGFVGEI